MGYMTDHFQSLETSGPLPATLLRAVDQDYRAPSPEDLRAVMALKTLSASAIADLTGVSSRTVRKWTSLPDSPNFVPIPYAAWRLLLLETELVKDVGAIGNPPA
jgi:hypothetical protein